MKTWILCAGLLCGDITPAIDDRFESENRSQPAQTEKIALPITISPEAAGQLNPRSGDEVESVLKLNGQAVTLEAKVHSVYVPKSGSPLILNLGADFKTCTKAVIFDRNYRDWNRSAVEIGKLYEGRVVLIEGQVTLYKELPQVEISVPANIRVIE